MADPGSIDDFLSSEIDENAVNALVGSLETQLASPATTQASKTLSDSSYNNNHIGTTATSSASARPLFLANQTVIPGKGNPVSSNVTLNSHSSVSTPKLSGSGIIGISSIINSSSTPVSAGGVAHVNVNTSSIGREAQKTPTPTIRIVTQPSNTLASSTNSAQFITSVGSVSQSNLASANTNNVHGVQAPNMGAVTRTSATAASSTIYNMANAIAAEQKPMTVVHNGSAHPIQVTKDRAVLPQQQFIVKQDGGQTTLVKQEGAPSNQQFIVKQELGPVTTVHIKPETGAVTAVSMQGSSPANVVYSGKVVNTTLKGMTGVSNPSVITVRTHPHPQQVTVVQPQGVSATQPNMSQPMQVVNVSASPGAPRLASVTQVKQGGVRVTTPIRIAQQPSIAPRQTGPAGSTGTITIPHGALLMRNEQGQLMLVSAGQPAGTIHPSSVITTTSVPITTSAGLKIQRPTVAQAMQRPGTVVIQPGSGQPRAQQVTLTQPPAPRVITQQPPTMPTPSIAHPQPTVVAAAAVPANQNDHNKMMVENVKKCKNFLSTLLKLAANQPASTVKNVRDLIQGLIDSKVEPEAFTLKLQHELKSSPQPYLVPFLKKSLPMLRQSMQLGKMGIDGINPPPIDTASTSSTQVTQVPVQRPQLAQSTPKVASSPQIVRAQVPKVTPQPTRPPIPQTLGPHSKVVMTGIRHHAPSAANSASAAARAKGGASAAVTAALQAHTQKTEGASPAASHKEKRKFEALKDDNDDINDVATMGGVNLSEESKNILATNSELIGSQIRSCKDETFLPHAALMARMTAIAKKHGLDDVASDVSSLISHATQQRLRDIVSKLSTIAEHRVEMYKIDPRYEVTSEVRGQLKFLEELDRLEKKRHEEQEREMLLRAMKSRSKTEDPEQQKLKQKAKELQQAEAEEMRQQQANQTALAAIGPRKKQKLDTGDSGASSSSSVTNGPGSAISRQSVMSRPRFKRANLKDLIFLMEQDRTLNKSKILYRTFLK